MSEYPLGKYLFFRSTKEIPDFTFHAWVHLYFCVNLYILKSDIWNYSPQKKPLDQQPFDITSHPLLGPCPGCTLFHRFFIQYRFGIWTRVKDQEKVWIWELLLLSCLHFCVECCLCVERIQDWPGQSTEICVNPNWHYEVIQLSKTVEEYSCFPDVGIEKHRWKYSNFAET